MELGDLYNSVNQCCVFSAECVNCLLKEEKEINVFNQQKSPESRGNLQHFLPIGTMFTACKVILFKSETLDLKGRLYCFQDNSSKRETGIKTKPRVFHHSVRHTSSRLAIPMWRISSAHIQFQLAQKQIYSYYYFGEPFFSIMMVGHEVSLSVIQRCK